MILRQHAATTRRPKLAITTNKVSTAYQLRYSTRDSIKLYFFMYSANVNSLLLLNRKYNVFNSYLKQRGITKDSYLNIVDTKGPIQHR